MLTTHIIESENLCFRREVEELTRPIATYLEDGREDVYLAGQDDSSSVLPDEVLVPMQMWLQTPDSKMIWVEGDPMGRVFLLRRCVFATSA